MIDWTRVSDLREEIGAEDFAEVVEIFLEEVEAAMESLGGDHASLEAQLHFLKGSALNLGFVDFSDLCGAGESRAANGATDIDLAEIAQCYAASQDTFLEGLATRFAA
jgi:HPt (histidine-containing phosphotransfer) domain-containing protein